MGATTHEYESFEQAYSYFDGTLFESSRPAAPITLQRKSRTFGFYQAHGFRRRAGSDFIDEISFNPANFPGRPDLKILSTLVHEMIH